MPFFGSTPGVPSNTAGVVLPGTFGNFGVPGNPGVIGEGPDVIPVPPVYVPPTIAWSTTMSYNGPLPPSSGALNTLNYNIGTLPAFPTLGKDSALYIIIASMPLTSTSDIAEESDAFSVQFTAADSTVIDVPYYFSAALDIPFAGQAFGSLVWLAVQDPKLSLGGSINLTIIQSGGNLLFFSGTDNGVVVACLADAANLIIRPSSIPAYQGGYGPHGGVGINPQVGDSLAGFAGVSPGASFPGDLIDPGTNPILATVARFENVTTVMGVGYPTDEPGWTVIAQIANPASNPVSLLVAFYNPTGITFNSLVTWRLTTNGSFTVGRNAQLKQNTAELISAAIPAMAQGTIAA